MISIGMSNTSSEFLQFIRLANADPRKNPQLLMIDAARNGDSAAKIANPSDDYWIYVDREIQLRGASVEQVQVAWLKNALAGSRLGFPENAQFLQRALHSIVAILKSKYRQLKLLYVSSRVYGGYAETELSPEPIAYESAFAVKWLIEEYINNPNGKDPLPWLSWGPYLWADGLNPRGDGLVWERSDFHADGIHTSPQGAMKVAKQLFEFLATDPTAKPWFLVKPNL